ncbi:MAG: trehalose-phosphatase [Tetrasphaera sp.]
MTPDPLPARDDELMLALARFAALPRVVVASDFDGVLAPLVDDPMSSRPLPGTMAALRELSTLPGTTVALVSGRGLGILAQLTGVPPGSAIALFGSHGGEGSLAGVGVALTGQQLADLREVTAALAQVVADNPPARLERKPMASVLHTRGIDPLVAARAEAAAVAVGQARPGVEIMHGKDVVELAVARADKGSAVLGLAASVGADAICYLGDDLTDESVFTRLGPADVGVKVGAGASAAAYRLPGPDAVPALLATLAVRRLEAGG